MSDLVLGALPGAGPRPTAEQIVEAARMLRLAQASATIARLRHANPARGASCPPSMAAAVEARARRLFPDEWSRHGLEQIRAQPYSLGNFETGLLTRRVLAEREPQRAARDILLGNGCCDRRGCPTDVFHRAVLAAVAELQTVPHCRWCGREVDAPYCGDACSAADSARREASEEWRPVVFPSAPLR
jgi:hypothetical protein